MAGDRQGVDVNLGVEERCNHGIPVAVDKRPVAEVQERTQRACRARNLVRGELHVGVVEAVFIRQGILPFHAAARAS